MRAWSCAGDRHLREAEGHGNEHVDGMEAKRRRCIHVPINMMDKVEAP